MGAGAQERERASSLVGGQEGVNASLSEVVVLAPAPA